ncbi:VOC family protein, partial [Microvirga sp. 3-52]|nr:VOC family protein [Microvirga sp. 3-52]
MKLAGIHHVSAITADAEKNHDFFTLILGMRLV